MYSDDSDNSEDAPFKQQTDNGIIWSLYDYANGSNITSSDILGDVKNSYFIGSNQTIYYAKEDSNYILDKITNNIYYVGCKGDGKTRGKDNHIYNFGFSGGLTRRFFLSEFDFKDKINNTNNAISDKKNTVITDSTDGKSNIIPTDSTSQTYPNNSTTDNTTDEQDKNNADNKRPPYISDSTSPDKTDDTSNWSIWDFLKGIFDVITNLGNMIKSLFVPSENFFGSLFSNLNDWFSGKLGFIFYPFELIIDILEHILTIDFGEPIFNIPDIQEPFTNSKLISAKTFNLNDLLENNIFKTVHDIYLVCVDTIIIFYLVNLAKNKFKEITEK